VDDPCKTAQRVENVLVEEMFLRFCRLAREKYIPLTHEIVRVKALQYAKLAGPAAAANFTASNGFLNKFFSRHNLVSVIQHGEATLSVERARPRVANSRMATRMTRRPNRTRTRKSTCRLLKKPQPRWPS